MMFEGKGGRTAEGGCTSHQGDVSSVLNNLVVIMKGAGSVYGLVEDGRVRVRVEKGVLYDYGMIAMRFGMRGAFRVPCLLLLP